MMNSIAFATASVPILVMLTFTLSAQDLPDPTRPYLYDSAIIEINDSELESLQVNWRLTGIRIRGDERTAILNGKLLRDGDNIGPARLLEIRPTEVLIEENHRQIVVKLLIPDIKTATTATAGVTE